MKKLLVVRLTLYLLTGAILPTAAASVTYDDKCREPHVAAALDDLGYSLDGNDFIV